MYYGSFPVSRARIVVIPEAGRGTEIHGTTWGNIDGFNGVTRIKLGSNIMKQDLLEDWTLTHELIHMALASFPDEQHWMEEGAATYVEPIARAQAGQLTANQVWEGMVSGMPQGLPRPGDRGLDRTHSWGRTYWGGALFCLVADVEIHKRTHNRKGLQDALQGIVAAGGTIDKEWSLSSALEIGDKATGTTALADLYKQWKNAPVQVDLQKLWQQLGINDSSGDVTGSRNTSLATIRQAITSPRSTRASRNLSSRP